MTDKTYKPPKNALNTAYKPPKNATFHLETGISQVTGLLIRDVIVNVTKYSPLHNLKVSPGVQWPATLLMTADHDDRVVPSHTLKYIAQLYHLLHTEAAEWQRKPVMARVEVRAGHGAGKPTTKVIAEVVDMYCFLQRVLKMNWTD
ncbi:prolyl oligopeptidase family domain-containing protein [Ditylenchus destructor]|uniref:Prolyl endopeptidase n=1 Tax=Ditylenchus destructor TaxID=166010 RepID=A0AAD4RAB4_9BILA|nr:prolyl oligopeptidase family domain-containing protein [Ditylenchus destructor]